ncbi:MAG: NAD(P)-dependent alcohol dehydrogenase [Chloroflexi bacterium]|nr:NAD(P)-dependent alcohol dehydrogenase [Chloroflexota bacterium]
MKSARLYGPRDIRVEEVPRPDPRAGEVLIRVRAVGICGSDVHYFQDGGIGDKRVTEPHELGHEFAGEIVALGPGVAGPPVGTPVAVEPAISCGHCEFCLAGHPNLCPDVLFVSTPPTRGSLAEYIAHPVQLVFPLPEELDFVDGAMLEPLGVAIHSVNLAKLRPGDTAAVLGSGPIGLLTLQVARLGGARRVYATDLVPERLAMAGRLGADGVCQADAADPVAWIEELTGGRGVDVVFEAAWAAETVTQAVAMARPGGRVVVAGIPSAADALSFPAGTARRKGLTIKLVRRMKHTYPRATALVEQRLVDVRSLVTHRFPLAEAAAAFELAEARADGVIKALVEM